MGGDHIILALYYSRIAPNRLSRCGTQSILSQGGETDLPVTMRATLTGTLELALDGT